MGLFTSPHLLDFRERIRVNGVMVSEDFVCRFVEEAEGLVEEVSPSFFELTTMMALVYFREQGVDFAVIEVGMGGRLDSTNIIQPILSVITASARIIRSTSAIPSLRSPRRRQASSSPRHRSSSAELMSPRSSRSSESEPLSYRLPSPSPAKQSLWGLSIAKQEDRPSKSPIPTSSHPSPSTSSSEAWYR